MGKPCLSSRSDLVIVAPGLHTTPPDSRSLLEGISAVTFDVGGTLIECWPSVGHIYAEVAALNGAGQVSPELLQARFAEAWDALGTFRHTRAQWAALVDKTFVGLTRKAPSKTFFPRLYERFAEPGAWRVFPDVIPTLEALKTRRLRLGVISNWDERLKPLLHALGLAPYFQSIIVSSEVGFTKPDGILFTTAACQLNARPTAVLHVGDSLSMDVRGAEMAGFRGVLLDRSNSDRAPGSIGCLQELLAE